VWDNRKGWVRWLGVDRTRVEETSWRVDSQATRVMAGTSRKDSMVLRVTATTLLHGMQVVVMEVEVKVKVKVEVGMLRSRPHQGRLWQWVIGWERWRRQS